jgi:transposase
LNLEDPWYIKTIDFSAEGKKLDINADFEPGSKFPCAKCGNPGCNVRDTIERTWRHLNFFQFKTYIHCRVPRTICEDCGVKQSKVPWARKGSGFTLIMESLIVLMAQYMTVTAIAEMIDEHDLYLLFHPHEIARNPSCFVAKWNLVQMCSTCLFGFCKSEMVPNFFFVSAQGKAEPQYLQYSGMAVLLILQ